jgi:hydrogenase/urease accessory protein HupE
MNIANKLLTALVTASLSFPGVVMAHPGHEHQSGILERFQHAAIGWDQLALLLLVGVVAGVLFYRQK